MELTTYEADGDAVKAGYACPCGCNPSATYQRGAEITTDDCCCGNEFAVGPHADSHLKAKEGFDLQVIDLDAPWGESIQAAWLIGDSKHPDGSGHDHGNHHSHDHHASADSVTVGDVVCGMTVDPATAKPKGLHTQHEGTDYYFCGKGCLLEFGDDPARFLDPSYVPSM